MKKSALLKENENLKEDIHEQGLIIDCLQTKIEIYEAEIKSYCKEKNKNVIEKIGNLKYKPPMKIIFIDYKKSEPTMYS